MLAATANRVYHNLSRQALIQHALDAKEGQLTASHALAVTTGHRTGRSPKDRFIVKDHNTTTTVAWGNINQAISADTFNRLWQKATNYLSQKTVFTSDLQVGANPQHALPVKVITELAWHQLFVQHLFIQPETGSALNQDSAWTLINAASLHLDAANDGVNSDGVVIIDFSQRRVLVCGIRYAGEMKKAMFSVLNYLLPQQDILPMHCSANVGENNDVALFFGLSGTGKTTLSADPDRFLIGDDEHGWSHDAVFNFEGGCYAKCINLTPEHEPLIWHAIRDGAIIENVIVDETGTPDYTDDSLTQNTRAAYPRQHIEKRVLSNQAGTPSAVIFLTCDLYGVLPPIALLTYQQAAYYFLSGYTALVGSTEMGQHSGIRPTFSTCFGAPFFPRAPQVYANLLTQRLQQSQAPVYLINTGWTGGAYGQGGERFKLPITRAIVKAALSGEVKRAKTTTLPGFNLIIPQSLNHIDSQLLNPQQTWANQTAYTTQANQLIELFNDNFKQFDVDPTILAASPNKME